MGMLSRLANLIETNIQSMMDKAEDPARSLDVAISDMKQGQQEARRALVQAKTAQRLAVRRREMAEQEVKNSEACAILALQNGQETEARDWFDQSVASAERARIEASAIEEQAVFIEQLEIAEKELNRRLRELPAKKAVLLARRSLAKARGARGTGNAVSVQAVARAYEAFERIEAQVIEAEVEAEVLASELSWNTPPNYTRSHHEDFAFARLKEKAKKQLSSGPVADGDSSEPILQSASNDL